MFTISQILSTMTLAVIPGVATGLVMADISRSRAMVLALWTLQWDRKTINRFGFSTMPPNCSRLRYLRSEVQTSPVNSHPVMYADISLHLTLCVVCSIRANFLSVESAVRLSHLLDGEPSHSSKRLIHPLIAGLIPDSRSGRNSEIRDRLIYFTEATYIPFTAKRIVLDVDTSRLGVMSISLDERGINGEIVIDLPQLPPRIQV